MAGSGLEKGSSFASVNGLDCLRLSLKRPNSVVGFGLLFQKYFMELFDV